MRCTIGIIMIMILTGCTSISTVHHLERGRMFFCEENYSSADREFEHVLNQSPDNVTALLYSGWIQYFSEAYPKAEARFSLALQQKATDFQLADAHHGMARSAYCQSNYPTVIPHAERSLELQPEQLNLWLLLGWAQSYCYNYGKAEFAFRNALALESTCGEAWLGIGWSRYYRRDYSAATAAAEHARILEVGEMCVNELLSTCAVAMNHQQYRQIK